MNDPLFRLEIAVDDTSLVHELDSIDQQRRVVSRRINVERAELRCRFQLCSSIRQLLAYLSNVGQHFSIFREIQYKVCTNQQHVARKNAGLTHIDSSCR